MSNKILLGLAGAVAGLFFYAGYYVHGRLAETPAPVAVESTTSQAHETVRTITKIVTVKEAAPSGPRETTTTTQETTQAKVAQSKSVDSVPVPGQHQDRPRYSVGVLVTPRVDETWRDSYKPTAIELGYRVGDTPISAIGSYDWRRREFQLGVRVEW